jgi:diamine N-acetyltransferase
VNVVLRALVRDEFQIVQHIAVAAEQRRFLSTPDLEQFLEEAHLHPEFTAYAVVAEGEMVGFLSLGAPDDSGRAWVSLLMIDRRRQGRGYGRAAMLRAIEFCRESGASQLGLSVQRGNAAAIRLYESLGFAFAGAPDEQGEITGWLRLAARER